jgi:hypothetical protein
MNYDLILPDECVRYVRLQRTHFNYRHGQTDDVVARLYCAEVSEDFKRISQHLPDRPIRKIVGIGCGIGANEALLSRWYSEAALWLLDGDGLSAKHVSTPQETSNAGWHANDIAVYNDRAATEAFMRANGISISGWYPVGSRERIEADLFFSIYSWGYHYPISAYDIHAGYVLADLRRGIAENDARIRNPMTHIIERGPKYDRCIWFEH